MKWFFRAALYALLLTAPGMWIAPAYQRILLDATGALLGVGLAAPPDGAVDLSASNMLAIFVAMCLASGSSSWPRRLSAIAIGLIVLVAVEVVTGVIGILLDAPAASVAWRRLLGHALELSRWLAVPLAWGVLLGRAELPRTSAPVPASARRLR